MTDSPAGDSPLLRFSIRVTVAATARKTPESAAPGSASASATARSEAASDAPGGSCSVPTGAHASPQVRKPGRPVPAGEVRPFIRSGRGRRRTAQVVGERIAEGRAQPGRVVNPGLRHERGGERLVRIAGPRPVDATGDGRTGGGRTGDGRRQHATHPKQRPGERPVRDPAQWQPENTRQRNAPVEIIDTAQPQRRRHAEVGGVGDAQPAGVGGIERGGVQAGELEHVSDVEVEGAEDTQVLVDGLGEADGPFPGADDEVRGVRR